MRVSQKVNRLTLFRPLFMTDRENQLAACGCKIGLTDAARSIRRSGRTIPAGGEEPATSKNTKMGDLARRGKRRFATTVVWFPSQALGCEATLEDRRRSRANGPRKRISDSQKRPACVAPCGFSVRTPILWKVKSILSIATRALRWSTADRPRQIDYRTVPRTNGALPEADGLRHVLDRCLSLALTCGEVFCLGSRSRSQWLQLKSMQGWRQ
jgi:hypothetical protein